MNLLTESGLDANTYYQQGIKHKQQNDLENAVTCFRQAIELDVNNFQYHHSLGEIFTRQNKLDEAVVCYQKAIALDPNHFWSHHCLAMSLVWLGKYQAALVGIVRAIEIDSSIAASHDILGKVLFSLGKIDEAIEAYLAALKLEPKLAIAHHNLGSALVKNSDFKQAVSAYKKAIDYNPNFFWSYYEIAQVLIQQKECDLAITYCRQAFKIQPALNKSQIYNIYLKIADALIDCQPDQDLSLLCREANQSIQDFFFYLRVAQKLVKLERFDEAISFLEKAKELITTKKKSDHIPFNNYNLKLKEIEYLLTCQNKAKQNKVLVQNLNYKIIALGFNCVPRRICTLWGLKPRKSTGELTCPFDLAVHSYESVLEAIETDFNNYLNLKYLIPFLVKKSDENKEEFVCIKNTYYDSLFSHQRDKKYRENNFSEFIKIYNQRIKNFYYYIKHNPILFIVHTEKTIEMNQLFQVLSRKFPQAKFKIMFIFSHQNIYVPRLEINVNYITYYAPCSGKHLWSNKSEESILYEQGISEAIKKVILNYF